MRVGLLEMVKFGKQFFGGTVHANTFTEESCGVADLITSCAGGRNHRCAKLAVQRGLTVDEIEAMELNGQKLQGTLTSREVNAFLKKKGMESEYPLFTAVYSEYCDSFGLGKGELLMWGRYLAWGGEGYGDTGSYSVSD